MAGVDQHPPLGVEPVGRQVGIPEAAPVVGHLLGEHVGLVGVATEDVAEHLEGEQVTALDHVALDLVEQATAPRDPAAAHRRLTTHQQDHAQPEGAPHRPEGLAPVEVDPVAALHGLDAVVLAAQEERHHRQPGEVVGVEGGRVDVRERVVGRDPLPPLVGFPGPSQVVDHTHRAHLSSGGYRGRARPASLRQRPRAGSGSRGARRSDGRRTRRPGRLRGTPWS